jgi:hypothetical protein
VMVEKGGLVVSIISGILPMFVMSPSNRFEIKSRLIASLLCCSYCRPCLFEEVCRDRRYKTR